MSINLAIYQQNEGQMSSDLSPPQRRLPKFLAWLLCMLTSLQWDHDLLFTHGWTDGSNASNWITSTFYPYQSRVIDIDGAVYECSNVAGITGVVRPQSDTANWFKVLDTFIGIRERAHYTGQKIYLEFLLNRFYQVGAVALPFTGASHINQIYIANNKNSFTNFWLSNGGVNSLTSFIPNLGRFASNFLGNAYPTFSKYHFTIYCPSAVATSIGNNQPAGTGASFINGQSTAGFTTAQIAAGNVIMALAGKYAQCNFLYNFQKY